MKKTLLTLALVLAAGGAQAVPLSNLLAGGSITAGDKLFDRWSLIDPDGTGPKGAFETSDARAFDPNLIEVTAINDGNPAGPGLSFAVNQGLLSITGDDIYAFVDLHFGFRASVLNPGMAITGNTLAFAPAISFLTNTADGNNDLGMYIRETLGTAFGLNDLGPVAPNAQAIEFSLSNDVLTSEQNDFASFAPQSEVWVTKNILVWSADSTDTASLNGFSQRFSQTAIPEPATLALFGLGLLGLGFARRRA